MPPEMRERRPTPPNEKPPAAELEDDHPHSLYGEIRGDVTMSVLMVVYGIIAAEYASVWPSRPSLVDTMAEVLPG
jgi:hypothetical protein